MLLIPGPVELLDDIRIVQSREMISHKGKEFRELYSDLTKRFKQYTGGEEGYILTGSGTLGVETIVLNACDKNDKAIVLENGEFGKRLGEIFEIYANTKRVKVDIGKGWNIERAKQHVDESEADVLGIVHNDTAAAVTNSIKEICKYAKKKGMRTVVDGVSAWPAHPFNMKEFSVDFYTSGSQKAIGASPGLCMISLSKDGVEYNMMRKNIPSFYSNLKRYREYLKKNETPFTPAITLMFALQRAFDHLDKEGMEACIKRHAEAGMHVRETLKELGFKLVAEEGFYSNTITAFYTERCEEIKNALKQHDIQIAGGLGELKEKTLRIAHIGNFTMERIKLCMSVFKSLFSKNILNQASTFNQTSSMT